MGMTLFATQHPSPVGDLLLIADEDRLRGLYMSDPRYPPPRIDRRDSAAPFAAAREQLDAYFAGELEDFDLPIAPEGTGFQLQVWDELRRIPFGETISY